jgi:hypothetical protein
MKPQTIVVSCSEKTAKEIQKSYGDVQPLIFGDIVLGYFEIGYLFEAKNENERFMLIEILQILGETI